MSKKTAKTRPEDKVLQLLRQKQQRLGINYLKTDSSVYKLLSALTYIFGTIAVVISALIPISTLLQNAATLNNKSKGWYLKPHIEEQILADNEWSVYLLIVVGFLLLGLFLRTQKRRIIPYIASIFLITISGIVLISMFYVDLSKTIAEVSSTSFIWKNLLPIGSTVLFAAASSVIAIRQYFKDKEGCDQIKAYIYNKYSAIATDLSEEDWNTVINDFEIKSKKERKKAKKEIPSKDNTEV